MMVTSLLTEAHPSVPGTQHSSVTLNCLSDYRECVPVDSVVLGPGFTIILNSPVVGARECVSVDSVIRGPQNHTLDHRLAQFRFCEMLLWRQAPHSRPRDGAGTSDILPT